MNQFSNTAKVLHWAVAALIVSQYVLAKLAENAKYNDRILEQLALLANHKSVGITILGLALVRLLYRLKTPAPVHPSTMPSWQRTVSTVSHCLLYGFLFAMPISGWLMSSAKAYSVSWFNLIALPDFVAPNENLAEQLHAVHHYLAEALFVVAVIHILAAVKHHYIDKDDVLIRMSSRITYALFVLIIIIIIGVFGRVFNTTSAPVSTENQPAINATDSNASELTIAQSDLPIWNIDYDQSYIRFSGDQAGAPFEGEWQRWSAEIQFDKNQLDKARFNVSIDPSSGFSNDQERDDTIRSSDFFHVESFPNAYYRAALFSAIDGSYQSKGELSMKGISADTILNFDISNSGNSIILEGSATLDRLVWNIGIGDWADTSWVGQNVTVEVRVLATP